MRLFAALVPPPDARSHLRAALEPWTAGALARPRLRWTDPAQWHVTLAFYGEVPDGAVPDLVESIGEALADMPAPALRLRGAGSFSGRTLWVGVAGDAPADADGLGVMLDAAGSVGDVVGPDAQEGLDRRDRRRAHLTLARVAPGARRDERASAELAAVVRALAVYEGPVWSAEDVVLVRSRLGAGRAGGPLHEAVGTIPFVR